MLEVFHCFLFYLLLSEASNLRIVFVQTEIFAWKLSFIATKNIGLHFKKKFIHCNSMHMKNKSILIKKHICI